MVGRWLSYLSPLFSQGWTGCWAPSLNIKPPPVPPHPQARTASCSLVPKSLAGHRPGCGSVISIPFPRPHIWSRCFSQVLAAPWSTAAFTAEMNESGPLFGCLQLDNLTERGSNFKVKILLCKQSWDEIYHKTAVVPNSNHLFILFQCIRRKMFIVNALCTNTVS